MHETDDQESDEYFLTPPDRNLIFQISRVLESAVQATSVTWATKVTLAKLLHVFSRLPRASEPFVAEVTIKPPLATTGEETVQLALMVEADGESLSVRYGGYYRHRQYGGDSFEVFSWLAWPGDEPEFADHREHLGAVFAVTDPVATLRGLADQIAACDVEATDGENTLLDDDLGEDDDLDEDEDGPASGEAHDSSGTADDAGDDAPEEHHVPVRIEPVNEFDRMLLARVGLEAGLAVGGDRAFGIERCDGCGALLADAGLFIDGNSPRAGWGNYCAKCAMAHGVPIGWGKGQLYARQADGRWVVVAGARR